MPASFIISVLGGKGGVGKSTFATNYAIATAIDSKARVLLVDLDPKACGDVAMLLGIRPKRTLVELGQHEGRLDANQMMTYVAAHPSGIHFLPSVIDADQMVNVDPNHVGKALSHALNFYNIIIVDVGSDLEAPAVKALELSTMMYILTMPELIVLHHTRRLIERVQNLLFPPDMIKLILNCYNPKKGILPQMVQNNLKKPILGIFPDDEMTTVSSMTKAQPFIIAAPRSELTQNYFLLVRTIAQQQVLEKLSQLKKPSDAVAKLVNAKGQSALAGKKEGTPSQVVFDRSQMKDEKPSDAWSSLKQRIHRQLIETIDLKKVDTETGNDPKKKAILREKTKTVVVELLDKEEHPYKSRDEIQKLVKEILDEALELGPIQDLLADDTVSEIMVNRRDQIFVERSGKLVLSNATFSGNSQLLAVIERIVTPLGRRIDEKTPYVDARLPDGSRVHAIIPPLSVQGPMLTIRKFAKHRLTHKDLIKFGSMTEEMADFLRACIEARLNIIISGGTGSGKTTLLNVLASFIPPNERILTVEDAAELQLPQEHWGRLETRPANIEGKGEVSIRELVRNTLRMRPDRIVVGECRAGEALDMLQAMNTGHDGSMTTVHANAPRDAIARLETLVMMAGMDLPAKAIREQIASAVNLVVQQSRLADGSRRVTSITEIVGMQGDVVTMQEIFAFKKTGMDKNRKVIGKYVATGFIPKFIDELEQQGIKIPRHFFRRVGVSMFSPFVKFLAIGWVGAFLLIGLLINGQRLYSWIGGKATTERDSMGKMLDLMFVEITPERLMLYYAGYLIGMFLLFMLLAWPSLGKGIFFGGLWVILSWKAPGKMIALLHKRRIKRFVFQMMDGLSLMSNAMRSGLNVPQALQLVSDELPNPIAQEFGLVLSQNKLGVTLEDAMSNLSIRMPNDDIEMFTTSVNILKETGGNLAETFDSIAYTIRERIKIESKIAAMTAQGVFQGIIVVLMPFALAAMLYAIDPMRVAPMFTTLIGWAMLTVMISLQAFGGFLIWKIVQVRV